MVAGCASSAGFNKTYLPKAVADNPGAKIALSPEDGMLLSRYLSESKFGNHVGLYWMDENVIYLNLADSAVFGIDTAAGAARELVETKARAAREKIARKVNIAPDDDGRGVIRQYAAKVLSYMGHKFTGSVTDNGHKIGVEVKTSETRDDVNNARCASAKISGKLTGSRGKITDVEWNYSCDWVAQSVAFAKVPQLLSALQVSPSGQYYLYGTRLYNVDKNTSAGDIISNYAGMLAVSANPAWTKIAVLRGSGKTYWIEIFDFQIGDKRGPSILRFDI